MQDNPAEGPKWALTQDEILALEHVANKDVLMKTQFNQQTTQALRDDVPKSPKNKTFHIRNSGPIKSVNDITDYIGDSASYHYKQSLLNTLVLDQLGRLSQPQQAQSNALLSKIIFSQEESQEKLEKQLELKLQTKLTTLKIHTNFGFLRSPFQFVFLPGTVTYNRKYVQQNENEPLSDYYELESIKFSNSVLKKLYEGKIALNSLTLGGYIDIALLEETPESQYEYFKSVAEHIISQPFTNNYIKTDADKKNLASYQLKYLKKMLKFLSQTTLFIDEEFKNFLRSLRDNIPDLEKHLDNKAYQRLNLLLNTDKIENYWPLKYAVTPESKSLQKSQNPAVISMRQNGWKNNDAAEEIKKIISDIKKKTNQGSDISAEEILAERAARFFRDQLRNDSTFTVNGKRLSINDDLLIDIINDIFNNKTILGNNNELKKFFEGQFALFDHKRLAEIDPKIIGQIKIFALAQIEKNLALVKDNQTLTLVTKWQKAIINNAVGSTNPDYSLNIAHHANLCSGEELLTCCLNIDNEKKGADQLIITTSVPLNKLDFQIINDKPYIVSTITDGLKIRHQHGNTVLPTTIAIPGTVRMMFNLATMKLESIEASNSALLDLMTKNHGEAPTVEYLKNLSQRASVEEFKENFERFNTDLQNNLVYSLLDYRDEFIDSLNLGNITNKTRLELIDALNKYLNQMRKTFLEHAKNNDPSALESSIQKIRQENIQSKAELKQTLTTLELNLQITDNKMNDFFEMAILKSSQAYTNQSIYNIAKHGLEVADDDISKAHKNIEVAKELAKKSNIFYRQKSSQYNAANVKHFFDTDFISYINNNLTELDIPRHKWDVPLKNLALAIGTVGTAFIFSAIRRAITGTEWGRKLFHVKEQTPILFFTHTKSAAIAKATREKAEKLEHSLAEGLLPKTSPSSGNSGGK